MNYVFFGNNVPLAERLRKALGTGVIECITLLQMKNTLLPAEEMDYCVFIEKTDPTLNIPAITHLHKTFQNIYIVLIAPEMTREEKIAYLQAGTDCVISESTSKEDLVKLLSIAEKCKRMEKARKPQMKESDRHFQAAFMEKGLRHHFLIHSAPLPLPNLYHHGDLDQAGGQRSRFLQVETSRQQL